jgi:hypothetical protein
LQIGTSTLIGCETKPLGRVAELPRDLVTLEEWDALELDEARRWELVEGGIVMTPRPRPLHQVVSRNLSQLIREHATAFTVLDGKGAAPTP